MSELAEDLTYGVVDEEREVFYAKAPRCVLVDKTLSPQAKLLYFYLKSRCIRSETTWVTQATIAEHMDLSERHLRRMTNELVKRGLVRVQQQRTGQTTRNFYFMASVATVYKDEAYRTWTSLKLEPHPDTHVRPEPDTHVRLTRTPMSAKVEEVTRRSEVEKRVAPSRGLCAIPDDDPLKQFFETMQLLPICKAKFKLKEYREWAVGLMEETHITIPELESEARKWQEYHNESAKKPKSPKASFRTWIGNYLGRGKTSQPSRATFLLRSRPSSAEQDSILVNNFETFEKHLKTETDDFEYAPF